MEPNPRLTLYFVGMKKIYAKHCWLVVLVHVKLTLLVSTAVTCPKLSVISNGGLLPSSCTSSGGKYQNKCSYYCSSGYTLQGGQFRVCQADGTWDGTAPTCKKRTEYICFLFLRFDFLNIFNIFSLPLFLHNRTIVANHRGFGASQLKVNIIQRPVSDHTNVSISFNVTTTVTLPL